MHSIESGTYSSSRTPSPDKLKVIFVKFKSIFKFILQNFTAFQFYEDLFENRFLKDTEAFFKDSPVVQDESQPMHVKMAMSATILENEARLCEKLLFLPTVEKTLKLLRMLFVLGPMDRFVKVLPAYVSGEKKAGKQFLFSQKIFILRAQLGLQTA